MRGTIAGFDWDHGNSAKCLKHGGALDEIEWLFEQPVMVLPSPPRGEIRFKAIGRGGAEGRHIFLVFTIRERDGRRYIRPISARYVHRKEVEHYEKENPGL